MSDRSPKKLAILGLRRSLDRVSRFPIGVNGEEREQDERKWFEDGTMIRR